MKKLLLTLIILGFGQSWAQTPKTIKLSDVVNIVSTDNYKVHENALKVYQAKENISKARADLLPKLNIWNIAKIVIDPLSIYDQLTDIAPFLVPGNWFRLEEVKLLYLAEREGYRALWSNEVHTAKNVYKNIQFDEKLLAHIEKSIVELDKVLRVIKTREIFGGAEPGAARDMEIRILGLKEDVRNLMALINIEYDQLTFMLGMPANQAVQLVDVELPKIETLKPIVTSEYEFRLLSTSPERRQFDHFLSVLDQVKKEVQYSVFGVSAVSRGAAGGVFDNIQIPNGLGAGQGNAMNIVASQKEIVRTQRRAVEETLRRQLRSVGFQYNSDLSSYADFRRRVVISKESKDALLRRMKLGENIDVLKLSEASRNQILAETASFTVQYRVLNSMDRIQRLIFDGDYSMSPPLIQSLKGL